VLREGAFIHVLDISVSLGVHAPLCYVGPVARLTTSSMRPRTLAGCLESSIVVWDLRVSDVSLPEIRTFFSFWLYGVVSTIC
jgi:hypothetical protein